MIRSYACFFLGSLDVRYALSIHNMHSVLIIIRYNHEITADGIHR